MWSEMDLMYTRQCHQSIGGSEQCQQHERGGEAALNLGAAALQALISRHSLACAVAARGDTAGPPDANAIDSWIAIREDGSPFPGEDHPAMVALRTGRPVTNVVMGVSNPAEGGYRWISDTVILVHLSGDRQWATAVSIPRDTYIAMPDCKLANGKVSKGWSDKFNVTYSRGGAACDRGTRGSPAAEAQGQAPQETQAGEEAGEATRLPRHQVTALNKLRVPAFTRSPADAGWEEGSYGD